MKITIESEALDTLKAMAEQDAKDAARYRWFRDTWINEAADVSSCLAPILGVETNEELDAAIDAAMQTK